MVKKEVFEWIRTGQKNIELRRGKAKKGDVAVSLATQVIDLKETIESRLIDVFRVN